MTSDSEPDPLAPACTLHHTHLMASDVDATIEFWVRCFGGRVVADTALAGVRNVLLEVGGGRLNLYDQPPNHRGVVNHLGVQVGDVSATVDALTEAGWEPRPIKTDGALSYAMVQGPDDLLVEVFHFDPETTEPHLRPYFDLAPASTDKSGDRNGIEHRFDGGGELSPEALARLAEPTPPPLELPDRNDHDTVARWRAEVNRGWLDGDPAPETVGHHEVTIGGVRCLAANEDRRGGTVVYVHGGGFCLGSPEVSVPITARLIETPDASAGFRLLSVDYRLAPEHPYPAGVDDVCAVLEVVARERPAAPVVLAGDSAGANIALAAALAAQDLPVTGVVLLSPHLDLAREADGNGNLDPRSDVDRTAVLWLTDAYRGSFDPRRPEVSPLLADLRSLPPILIQAGTQDNTMPDAVRLARRAKSAGASVTLDLWDGLWHTWHYHRELPEADAALAEVRRFIHERFGRPGAG